MTVQEVALKAFGQGLAALTGDERVSLETVQAFSG